ncbi:MAG: ABC transporter transmembrane domain-containing protein [Paracoccaceae bacterium]
MLVPAPRRVRPSGDDRPAATLSRYVRRMSGGHQAALCLLAVATSALALAPIELQRRLIDDAITAGNADLLWRLAGLYLGAVLLHRALRAALTIGQGWLAESATRHTRSHLARVVCDEGLSEPGKSPGETVSVLGKEAEKLGGYVGEAPSQTVANVALLGGVLAYMLAVEPGVAVVGVALLLPQVLIVPLLQRRLNRLNAAHVAESRGFGDDIARGGAVAARENRLTRLYGLKMRVHLWKAMMKGVLALQNNLAPLGILLWGGLMVIEGATSLGVVIAFVDGFNRMRDPLRELLALYRRTALTAVQHCLIAEWMEGKASSTDGCSGAGLFAPGPTPPAAEEGEATPPPAPAIVGRAVPP